MLDVCLAGTGGMMPLPYRHLTCLMLRHEGSQLLIDCGEGTQIALKKRGWSFHPIDYILFTHYHADHISGIIGLLLSIGNAERKEPVTLVGPRGLKNVIDSLRVIAPELPFPLEYLELSGAPQEHLKLGAFEITAFKARHRIPCFGYTVDILRQGRFLVEQAKTLGLPVQLWNRLQKGETVEYEGETYYPEMVLGPPRKGIRVSYCTDSRPTDNIVEGVRGADLFICEGMYGEKGSEERAAEHKHMNYAEAADLAREAGVKELWLTHFSPAMPKPDEYLEVAREIFPNALVGKDGLSRTFKFEEE
ncbi:MAG: ribonuclease Z [Lachnospiraceae bacterium]|nr:ribonuclease Z [Lachnospiraceae bacterium]